ncbi:ImmA/IrrE family metallo-endopeptidase [Fusobacterium mortiferum]|jgi:Zn-dependent peptidase ImmA (M78 family)|uniref:ImmA/IrrE family metallo-endopeptidase n=1 Tax=Fusobacterium mortiferum ATCC 9817 TaxID=469616 RepID=A0ABM6TXR8_FUSMR|nr:ImmA/IrrE family metallo-endopeptidase [Fusobacterium mortiferum]AVQ19222.1 ImmA/IrrE family metallo-endopeptidase [Fusobacterium mortiferum ATCC 9817]
MDIRRRVVNLEKKYGTRNPYKLCKIMKINILYMDLGNIKGIYKKVITNKFIVINENLDKFCQKVVLSHELGHAILHHSKEIQALKDYDLFPQFSNQIEVEANTFAAELLIDDDFDNDEYIENPSIDIRILEQLKELKYRKK